MTKSPSTVLTMLRRAGAYLVNEISNPPITCVYPHDRIRMVSVGELSQYLSIIVSHEAPENRCEAFTRELGSYARTWSSAMMATAGSEFRYYYQRDPEVQLVAIEIREMLLLQDSLNDVITATLLRTIAADETRREQLTDPRSPNYAVPAYRKWVVPIIGWLPGAVFNRRSLLGRTGEDTYRLTGQTCPSCHINPMVYNDYSQKCASRRCGYKLVEHSNVEHLTDLLDETNHAL